MSLQELYNGSTSEPSIPEDEQQTSKFFNEMIDPLSRISNMSTAEKNSIRELCRTYLMYEQQMLDAGITPADFYDPEKYDEIRRALNVDKIPSIIATIKTSIPRIVLNDMLVGIIETFRPM